MSDISVQSNSGTSAAPKVTNKQSTLGKDDFLKLLVTQMQYQDPLKPMDDTQFVSQMAQFTSLEQMQNMNSSMISTQANSMIGKQITWNGSDGQVYYGVVSAVKVTNGTPSLMVGDLDKAAISVDLSQVIMVENAPTPTPPKGS
ncbi:MAG: flagellar hook capping FlgD N-terminal domain-containing protein [Veillonellales bacterium]